MSDEHQLSLFPDLPRVRKAPRPWRRSLFETWPEETIPGEKLRAIYFDFLARNRQFLKALERAEVPADTPGLEQFLDGDQALLGQYALHRLENGLEVPEDEQLELFELALEVVEGLAELRMEILQGLEEKSLDRVLNVEPRFRISEFEIFMECAAIELQLAEERGLLTEMELPLTSNGFILNPDSLLEAVMDSMKDDQEKKPLPRQARLPTLLKGLPVQWLEAITMTLDVESSRLRKDREASIAKHLLEPERLRAVLFEALAATERSLLSLVLKEGGQCPAKLVTDRFGDDGEDGFFWDETTPVSVLGKVRCHGLVFVGRARGKKGVAAVRQVVIPRELREPVRDLLSQGESDSGLGGNFDAS